MLSRFFRKSGAARSVQQAADGIAFVDQVSGSGLDALRMQLAPRLWPFKSIENGYLPKLTLRGEANPRNCLLLVEREPLAPEQKEAIAAACAGTIALDIYFSRELPSELVATVTSHCRPLFLPGLALFECPLIVKRGLNTSMPSEWPTGVSFWYVAATSVEDALARAVGSARTEGFEFVDVYQGKVVQIDHTKWWDGVVMKQWREYATHLPTQQQMDAAVATGGIFMGPNIGPLAEG